MWELSYYNYDLPKELSKKSQETFGVSPQKWGLIDGHIKLSSHDEEKSNYSNYFRWTEKNKVGTLTTTEARFVTAISTVVYSITKFVKTDALPVVAVIFGDFTSLHRLYQ